MKWKLKTGAGNNHRTKWPKSLYILLYQEWQQLQRLVSLLILVRNVPQWTQLFIFYNSLRQIKCPLEYYFEAFEPNRCSFNLLCQAQNKKAKGATRNISMLGFIVDNILVGQWWHAYVYQQIIGIATATNCTLLFLYLFLYYYEVEFMQTLINRSTVIII